jgi:hypothetical protein
MVQVNQNHQLQWRVTLEDGEVVNWGRFQDAWAYAMPDAGHGWTYLLKAYAVARFSAGEKRICVAWKPNQQIFLEWV